MNFQNDLKKSIEILQSGGIILYPTDTIWGIGCDATNPDAVKKVYQLKKREEKKSMIILVSDEIMIRSYVSNPSQEYLLFISSAKKPTTAIFRNAIHLPTNLINEDGSIAIRIINDDFCHELIDEFKKPIVSTSANISGEPYPKNFDHISDKIKNGVDYIVQHRQNDYEIKSPSSIIRLNNEDELEILR